MMSLTPTESQEQQTVIKWADMQPLKEFGGKIGRFLFAIPNGGKRLQREAVRLRAEGVRAGVPDLYFAYPSNGYHGLFIEMKRAKKSLSHVSDEQIEWQERLNAAGYLAVVCYGADEAIKTITDYLNGSKKNNAS